MTAQSEAARIVWIATQLGERTGNRVTTAQADRIFAEAIAQGPKHRANVETSLRAELANTRHDGTTDVFALRHPEAA